jgi:glycosyltransferase involved in cell wall biosynthesis
MQHSPRRLSSLTVLVFVAAVAIAFIAGMNFAGRRSLLFPTSSSSSEAQAAPCPSYASSCPKSRTPGEERTTVSRPTTKTARGAAAAVVQGHGNDADDHGAGDVAQAGDADDDGGGRSHALPPAPAIAQCVARSLAAAKRYVAYAEGSEAIKAVRGPLRIAAFSRLWVPPLHGTGGMQFHAYHLYSQLAVRGHIVHVFVTGPPEGGRSLMYAVDAVTHVATITNDAATATLFVHQVASAEDGEYTVRWYDNCVAAFAEVNRTIAGGFQVVHSESWAAVPNVYQLGLPAAVTWHGSMLDWFRNEVNLIVHNFRVRGKMTSDGNAQRMRDLGVSVSYEAYMLLSVPDHIAISDSAASDLRQINLVDGDRVHVIYNGVNTRKFRPAADRQALRSAFLTRVAKLDAASAAKDDLFVIGCGGRLEGIKGHHQLSLAAKQVLERKANAVLLVAGRGRESHRYEALRAQGMRVVLLGMLNQQDLTEFYQSLDVFVDPFYQHHGLNTVMLEAALSGVAIVVTDLASARTTVPCNGGLGLTFPLGEPAVLAARLEWLEEHPEERRRMAAAARERSQLLFASSIMAARYERLLYDAAAHPRALIPITGKVVCKHAYPRMCLREMEPHPPEKHAKLKHE